MASNRRRGVSLIESLAAALVLSVATGGLFAAWGVGSRAIDGGRKLNVATGIGRGMVELSKAQGWARLTRPAGSSFAYGTATVDGIVVRTAVWTEPELFFDDRGAPLATNAPVASRRFGAVRAVSDVGVRLAVSGGGYVMNDNGMRRVVVTVRNVATSETLLIIGTQMAKGGV